MPYRPRELVMRAREAAARLLAALDRDEMVPRFLDVYAAEFRRPGRADHPVQYREQLQAIRREAILAMVFRIESSLPKRLKVSVTVRTAKKRTPKSKRAKGKGKPKSRKKAPAGMEMGIPFLDLFREEFFVALGQWLEWSQSDAEAFWRDLEFYEKLTPATRRGGNAKSARQNISGPFVDRVAMVLDPSLMEQARREAAKFQGELNAAADRLLQRVFTARRE
jgi:hypothetical protein